MSKKVCVICNKEFEGRGNNANPVKDGQCCDECNSKYVIPARLDLVFRSKQNWNR